MKFWVVREEGYNSIHDALLTSVGWHDVVESITECWSPGSIVTVYEVDLGLHTVRYLGKYKTGYDMEPVE